VPAQAPKRCAWVVLSCSAMTHLHGAYQIHYPLSLAGAAKQSTSYRAVGRFASQSQSAVEAHGFAPTSPSCQGRRTRLTTPYDSLPLADVPGSQDLQGYALTG